MTPVSSPAAPGVPGARSVRFCAPSRRGHARVAPRSCAPSPSRQPLATPRRAFARRLEPSGFAPGVPGARSPLSTRRRGFDGFRGFDGLRASGDGSGHGSLPSDGELDAARHAALAAERDASDAEARHAFFLERNARVLDEAAVEADSARAAAARAADRAARARHAAEQAARRAEAHAAARREFAESDACLYAAESAADQGRSPLDEDCVTLAARADRERAAATRAAKAAAEEHAAAAERLMRERSKAADAATRAYVAARAVAEEAEAREAAARRRDLERGVGFDDPANDIVWRGTKNVPVPADDPTKRREKDALSVDASAFGTEIRRRGGSGSGSGRGSGSGSGSVAYTNLGVAAGAGRSLGSGPLDASGPSDPSDIASSAGASSSETFVGDGNAFKRSPKPSASTSEVDSTGVFERVMRALGGGGAGEATASPGEKDLGAKMSPGDADGRGDGDEPFGFSGSGFSVSDSIAPAPEWMYPRWLDRVPALFGRLNPITGVLVYYTGAVLRECAETPVVALQWMCFVFFPALLAQCALRVFAHARAVERARREGAAPPLPFLRAERSAWLDLHLGYALLCPAGAVGGEGASWWLLLAPAFMLARFATRALPFGASLRRVAQGLGSVAALCGLLFSASGALTQAIASARVGGVIHAVVFAPVAFAATYLLFLAPASLLPSAALRAWRGEGFEREKKSPFSAPRSERTLEEASRERRKKRFWLVVGVLSAIVSVATGSDAPVFAAFFAQLLNADPGKLLDVMIDKGDERRAAFDRKVADEASKALANVRNRIEGRSSGEEPDVNVDPDAASDVRGGTGVSASSSPSAEAAREARLRAEAAEERAENAQAWIDAWRRREGGGGATAAR